MSETQSMIPVYKPSLSGNEKAYVNDCLDTTWISSVGSYVDRFESELARFLGVKHAIAVSNGTVALHLAVHCLGIGPGDEVLVPTFTYIASVNAIAQTGAVPVFVDCRLSDWLLDPAMLEAAITPKTKAIMAVHLYGGICDMAAINQVASRHGLHVIEDCAEALGSTSSGRHCGGLSSVGTFSFFGNKTVTTGEGGAVTTNDDALAERMRLVKGQGQSLDRRYWHVELGFNYRMTNICAAIGVAQLERVDELLGKKKALGRAYRERLSDLPLTFQDLDPNTSSSDWLISVLLPNGTDRDAFMSGLASRGVDSRPVFHCAHEMPMYASLSSPQAFPISTEISTRGVSFPSYPTITADEFEQVIDAVKLCL